MNMQLILKTMGFDPDAVKVQIEAAGRMMNDINDKLEALKKQNDIILTMLTAKEKNYVQPPD